MEGGEERREGERVKEVGRERGRVMSIIVTKMDISSSLIIITTILVKYHTCTFCGRCHGTEFIERCMHKQALPTNDLYTHAHTHGRMKAHMYACTHTRMHARTYTHTHAHAHAHTLRDTRGAQGYRRETQGEVGLTVHMHHNVCSCDGYTTERKWAPTKKPHQTTPTMCPGGSHCYTHCEACM